MRKRLISLTLTAALVLSGVTVATAACSGCSSGTAAPVFVDAASGCGGGSGPAPTTNVIEANCTRDFEGPDNTPPGQVTAYVTFVCSINLDTVTLTVSIWHSGGGGSYVGDKPEASHTCFAIEAAGCTVSVPCTEGPYLASFFLSALVDGKPVSDNDKTQVVTYSAGDCTL